MRTMFVGLSVVALCSLVAAVPTVAQEAIKQAVKPIEQTAASDTVEPAAVDALKAMGAYLAGLKTFDLATTFESDLVLDNNQKISIGGTTSYEVRRPDGLKVDVVADLGSRSFIYDGKTLTVVSPKDEAYGQVDVAPTIKEMLAQVATHLGIEVPLSDLFDYGTDDSVVNRITEAFLVSPAEIDGQATKHWAYRTAGKDFEVWIADGDAPVPVKIVVEDDTIPARPRFESNLKWTTGTSVADNAFTFTPPENYQKIGFATAEAGQTTETTK